MEKIKKLKYIQRDSENVDLIETEEGTWIGKRYYVKIVALI